MTKPDDSGVDPDQLRAVEERARTLLDRASAWERFPTPVGNILAAANLKVAPRSAFDPAVIIEFLGTKAAHAAQVAVMLKPAIARHL